jgi:hypothetical protein
MIKGLLDGDEDVSPGVYERYTPASVWKSIELSFVLECEVEGRKRGVFFCAL